MKMRLLGCGLASMLLGCSLIVTADKECVVTRDCAPGRFCEQGYCVKASLRSLITDKCPRVFAETMGGEMDLDRDLTTDTIVLGTLMPYTGELSAYGPKIDRGVQLAVSEINKGSGIQEREIAVLSCDSGTDPDLACASAKYLIDKVGVPAIIGPAGSSEVIKVYTEVAKDRGTLLITPSATAAAITNLSDPDDLLWRTCPSDALQGAAIAGYLKSSGLTRLAIVNRADTYGSGLHDVITSSTSGLCATFPCTDDKAFYNRSYPEKPYTDAQAAMMPELFAFKPQATVLVAYGEDGENFLKLADGQLQKFIVTDGMKADTLAGLAVGSEILCRLFGTQPASPAAPANQTFKLSYKARFGEPDGAFSANAYDALYLIGFALSSLELKDHPERLSGKEIGRGLKRVSAGLVISPGGTDFQKGVNQLMSASDATIDYAGASGPLNFDSFGEPTSSIEAWALNLDTKKIESLGVIQEADGQYVGGSIVQPVPGKGAACLSIPAR